MTSAVTVEGLAPLVGIMAAERTKDRPSDFDDAYQEGLIAAWRALENFVSPAYVTACARNAIGDVLRGRPSFGAAPHRGAKDAHTVAGPFTHDVDDDPDNLYALSDEAALAAILRAQMAPHAVEVRAAVADLRAEDATAVYLRFYEEFSWPEVAAHLGRGTEAVRRRFVNHTAPLLRERLSHLEEFAA